jgi:hypothetical protein
LLQLPSCNATRNMHGGNKEHAPSCRGVPER